MSRVVNSGRYTGVRTWRMLMLSVDTSKTTVFAYLVLLTQQEKKMGSLLFANLVKSDSNVFF